MCYNDTTDIFSKFYLQKPNFYALQKEKMNFILKV